MPALGDRKGACAETLQWEFVAELRTPTATQKRGKARLRANECKGIPKVSGGLAWLPDDEFDDIIDIRMQYA